MTDSISALSQSGVSKPRLSNRIDALDWARGWMLIASVGINSLALPIALRAHAEWASITPIDLIFPLFVTLSGCGLAFAYRRQVPPLIVARRTILLLLLGLGYNAIVEATTSFDELRFFGVLQLYAAVTLIVALLHLVTRRWQGWAIITALLAVAHTALLSWFAAGCPAQLLTPQCNPSGLIDLAIVGQSHLYLGGAAGHDPEGVIAIMGALISASAGATVGHLILRYRGEAAAATTRLPITTVPIMLVIAAFVVGALTVGLVPDLLGGGPVPAMKRLWTAPFALGIAAIAATLLWLGQWAMPSGLLRKPQHAKRWEPIVALGRNSLLVYFGSHIVMSLLARPRGDSLSLLRTAFEYFPSPAIGQVVWSLAWIAGWIILAVILHRRRWYVKV